MRRRQRDVREAARLMIERFGRSAVQQVDQRIRELREHGEDEALMLWIDVRAAVESMLNKGEDESTQ